MQFEDPKSVLEAAASRPSRGIDAHALVKRGTRLRRARLAAAAGGLAVVLAGASASLGLLGTSDRGPGPAGDVAAGCRATDRECLLIELCGRAAPLEVVFFLREDAARHEIESLKQRLRDSGDVSSLDHVTHDEAYEEFRDLYEGQPELWETFTPDALPASLRVEAVDQAALERVTAVTSPAVDEVRYAGEFRDRWCGDMEEGPAEEGPTPAPPVVRPTPSPGPDVAIRTPYVVPPPLAGPGMGEHVDHLLMSVDEAECDATPTWAGAPAPEPGTRWCRFRATISNLSDVPFTFVASNQDLQTADAILRPVPESRWSDEPIAPGETRTGDLVFGVPDGAHMEFVGLSTQGIGGAARPGAFGCGEVLETDGVVCSYSSDRALVRFRYRQSVELYHCGVEPFVFAGRRWISDPPPFDATNAPADFTGEGRIELLKEWEALYVDSSGAEIELKADWEWEPPPCA